MSGRGPCHHSSMVRTTGRYAVTNGRRTPWVLAAAALVVFLLSSVLAPDLDASTNALFFGIAAALLLVGALLMSRVRGNRVGVALMVAGLILTADVALGTYSVLGALASPVWPGTAIAGVLTAALYIYPPVIVLIGVPLIFPDGHLPSSRFRWVARATIVALAAATIAVVLTPGDAGQTGLPNPLGMPALVPAFDALNTIATVLAPFA